MPGGNAVVAVKRSPLAIASVLRPFRKPACPGQMWKEQRTRVRCSLAATLPRKVRRQTLAYWL